MAVTGLTAGTLTLKVGSGDAGTAISTNVVTTVDKVFTTDTVLSLTPSTDFDGTVHYVIIRQTKVQP